VEENLESANVIAARECRRKLQEHKYDGNNERAWKKTNLPFTTKM